MTEVSRETPIRVLNELAATPWALDEDYLSGILAIIERRNDFTALQTETGEALSFTRTASVRDRVAIVPVAGPIFRYANLFTNISAATSLEILATDFGQALRSPDVDAIVLEIDSPGGQVAGISEFAKTVYQARGQKPIVAYVEARAASAAYWIAAAADRIVIGDTAFVGSIGVVSTAYRQPNDPNRIEIVNSDSDRKRLDPGTDEGRASLQNQVDQLAGVFINAVASYRGVSVETVKADFGRGDVVMGREAVEAGMADGLGSMEQLIAELQAMPSRPRAVALPAPEAMSPEDRLRAQWTADPSLRSEFLDDFESFEAYMLNHVRQF